MIELNQTNNKQPEKSVEINPQPSKLFRDGKSSFVLGNYDKAIELFLSHLNYSPNDKSLIDTQLWLGRSYFYSESYLESKNAYLDFQALGTEHPKYADSLYELSRVYIELNEASEAKMLLTQMLEDYPDHILFNKASALIQSL
jgi:TolA-binding protein